MATLGAGPFQEPMVNVTLNVAGSVRSQEDAEEIFEEAGTVVFRRMRKRR